MDILINDIEKFAKQTSIIKKSIIEKIFDGKEFIFPSKDSDDLFYFSSDILIFINTQNNTGYLCSWNNDVTLLLYRYPEKCRARIFVGKHIVKTLNFSTKGLLTIYTFLADFYELENIIAYNHYFENNKILSFFKP